VNGKQVLLKEGEFNSMAIVGVAQL